MKIEWLPIEQVTPSDYNPRKDLKPRHKEFKRLRTSIQEFGFVDPLIWNKRTGRLIGGHQRLKVLKDLGHKVVPVSVVDFDDEKEKALNIALNKIEGAWDTEKLTQLLSELDDEFRVLVGFDKFEMEKFLVADSGELENFLDMDQQMNPDMVCPSCGHMWSTK